MYKMNVLIWGTATHSGVNGIVAVLYLPRERNSFFQVLLSILRCQELKSSCTRFSLHLTEPNVFRSPLVT